VIRFGMLMAMAALLANASTCRAGPCTAQIAKVEQLIAQAQANPAPSGAGLPSAPQTLGAQLHHQPNPGSIAGAEKKAKSDAAAALGRARKADAANDAAACRKALNEAKQIYGFE
jgi:hypothetical protein